jgi:3-phytase
MLSLRRVHGFLASEFILPGLFAILVGLPLARAEIAPRIVTEPVPHDSDDPAIWINRADPARSLVVGTDKDAEDGGLYVFDLDGKIQTAKTVRGLKRPNNVDIAYDFPLAGRRVDLAVVTERNASRLRVFALPDLKPVDNGGLPVFDRDPERLPMGIALYRRPRDGALFAIVSARIGPREGYLWQYWLEDDGHGAVRATKVREFGRFSGKKEIEAVAVDAGLGHVYYSDEQAGVHQYPADPDAPEAEREIAFFGTTGFVGDQEGISIFPTGSRTGYVIVSNQDGNTFEVFAREGSASDPAGHAHLASLALAARASDGNDVTPTALGPRFPHGLFVAMSEDRTFQFYAWEDLGNEIRRQKSKK